MNVLNDADAKREPKGSGANPGGRRASRAPLSPCIVLLSLVFLLRTSQALAQGISWEREWNETIVAAKAEGGLNVYRTTGPFEPLLREFQKRFPEIKVSDVVGRGSQLAPRIMAERRAGKYLADVYLGGAGTPYRIFYGAKILDAIPPLLLLPEVKDKPKWFQARHHYADPEEQYIFVFEGSLRSEVAYNTSLVNAKDFKSFWDLVNPKWKGKVGAIHPKVTGVATSTALAFFYYQPELGAKFLQRLFGEMDLAFSSEPRQLTDWLNVGKVAIAFFVATPAAEARKQGLPVDVFSPAHFKEGTYGAPRQGTVSRINRPPHPNASKVFINWLLSREGQTHFQRLFAVAEEEYLSSMRLDVPKDEVPAAYRLTESVKFLPIYRPEFMDSAPARKLVDEVLGAQGK